MKSLSKMKLIYEYSSYRKFLEDYYFTKKNEQHGFSFKHFSQLAGLKSPNYLKLIIDGTRDLTIDNIFAFAKALELGEEETHFFELLVHHNQSKSPPAKRHYKKLIEKIQKLKPKHGVKVKGAEILSQWFSIGVLTTAHNKKVGDFAEWSTFLGIKPSELQNIVNELIQLGVITVEKNLYCVQEDFFVFRDKKSISEQQKRYLYSQLQLSNRKFKEYQKGAKFIAHTQLINDKDFDSIVDKIYDFLQELTSEAEKSEPLDRLVQLNLQFFKLGDQ